jgi:hypothetical protein
MRLFDISFAVLLCNSMKSSLFRLIQGMCCDTDQYKVTSLNSHLTYCMLLPLTQPLHWCRLSMGSHHFFLSRSHTQAKQAVAFSFHQPYPKYHQCLFADVVGYHYVAFRSIGYVFFRRGKFSNEVWQQSTTSRSKNNGLFE